MGKQSRKRQRASGHKSADYWQPEPSYSPTRDSDLMSSPSVRDEIEDSLSKIYESFFQEFSKRIPDRCTYADPLDAPPPQRSILDKKVKERLVDRVRTLTHAIGTSYVYELFQVKTNEFIFRLLEAVKTSEEPRMALGLLEDAYDIMENAIDVVEGLIQVYSMESGRMVLRYGRSQFYGTIHLDPELKHLLDLGNCMEPLRQQRIYEMQSCELDDEDTEYQRKVEQQETFQRMSIEELVTFINDTPKPGCSTKKKQSECTTADEGKSPQSVGECDVDFDREINAFRDRLEQVSPVRKKIKPRLSEAWLCRIAGPLKGLSFS